jgi:signal transduction histidine kinase
MDEMEKPATAANYQDYKILIVDDNPVNLRVIVTYLESYGFRTRIARNGETAIQRVRYDPPDIILLDILMPGIDGFETCRQIKSLDCAKNIPIIFMTSLAGAEDKVKGFEAGAVDYVTKPLNQEEVLARVKTHLRLCDLPISLQKQNELLEYRSQIERERLFAAISQQHQQLRVLNHKLTEVQETERKQLARELHDELGQALTAISINLAAALQELPIGASPTLQTRLNETKRLADQTLEQVREISFSLRPAMLDDLGLVPALRWYVNSYARRLNVCVEFEVTDLEERLPVQIETALYRIFQEALTNIGRHAQANIVYLLLRRKGRAVWAYIEDDGVGFDLEEAMNFKDGRRGTGLLGMRERTALLGGVFNIQSKLGGGTQLSIEIPLEQGP